MNFLILPFNPKYYYKSNCHAFQKKIQFVNWKRPNMIWCNELIESGGFGTPPRSPKRGFWLHWCIAIPCCRGSPKRESPTFCSTKPPFLYKLLETCMCHSLNRNSLRTWNVLRVLIMTFIISGAVVSTWGWWRSPQGTCGNAWTWLWMSQLETGEGC